MAEYGRKGDRMKRFSIFIATIISVWILSAKDTFSFDMGTLLQSSAFAPKFYISYRLQIDLKENVDPLDSLDISGDLVHAMTHYQNYIVKALNCEYIQVPFHANFPWPWISVNREEGVPYVTVASALSCKKDPRKQMTAISGPGSTPYSSTPFPQECLDHSSGCVKLGILKLDGLINQSIVYFGKAAALDPDKIFWDTP